MDIDLFLSVYILQYFTELYLESFFKTNHLSLISNLIL